MPVGIWDRQVRTYCCSLLSDLICFKVTEKEESFSDTEEPPNNGQDQRQKTDREFPPVQEDQDEFLQSMQQDLLAPPFAPARPKKLLASVDFTLLQPKTEWHIKRFLGSTYRQPMVVSLLSIPDKRLLGVKVCLFKPETLSAKNYFLPVSFSEPFSSPKTAAFTQAFKELSSKLVETHLSVSLDHNLDARRASSDKRLYSFLLYQTLPFETLLIWSGLLLKARAEASFVASAVSTIARLRSVSFGRNISLAAPQRK